MERRWTLLFLASLLILIVYYYYRDSVTTERQGERGGLEGEVPAEATIVKVGDERMALVPAGEFTMGATHEESGGDEYPQRAVYVDAFFIDLYEVTNAQYKEFVDATGHRVPYVAQEWAQPYNWVNGTYPGGKGDHPVVLVSGEDATAYAAWMGKRLPTEAEWEKACRSGLTGKKYPWGDQIERGLANFDYSLIVDAAMKPVGSYPPNSFGLYDMAGNVWEWCSDWYGEKYYTSGDYFNPGGPEEGAYRVLRGGSFVNKEEHIECSQRSKDVPYRATHVIGFRCAKTIGGEAEERDRGGTRESPASPEEERRLEVFYPGGEGQAVDTHT